MSRFRDGRVGARSLPAIVLLALIGAAQAQTLPSYLDIVIDRAPLPSAHQLAEKSLLDLDSAMLPLYDSALQTYKANLRASHPVILALFDGGGGQLILYPPNQPPETAPPVSTTFQLIKSAGHSALALYEIVAPHLANSRQNQAWRQPLQAFHAKMVLALERAGDLDRPPPERAVVTGLLRNSIHFAEKCLAENIVDLPRLQDFANSQAPLIAQAIEIVTAIQVAHQADIIKGWKARLGPAWDRTYAVTNTLYVTRRNNTLFTVLAQYMGAEAINDRLFLFETSAFSTKPETMLDLLTRVVADRTAGKIFFKDYYLMDVELLSDGARKAIADQAAKDGMKPLMPPLAPFHSNAWPWITDPNSGSGPSSLAEALAQPN